MFPTSRALASCVRVEGEDDDNDDDDDDDDDESPRRKEELEEEVVVSMMHPKQRETQRPSNPSTVQSLLRRMFSLFVFYCYAGMEVKEWKKAEKEFQSRNLKLEIQNLHQKWEMRNDEKFLEFFSDAR